MTPYTTAKPVQCYHGALQHAAYPDEIIDDLVALVGVQPGHAVAQHDADGGALGRLLAARGLKVTALYSNGARPSSNGDENLKWQRGALEATGLHDGSQQWVVGAQTFHQADRGQALPEIRRVLAKDGAFTVMWNVREPHRNEVVSWTDALARTIMPDLMPSQREQDWGVALTSGRLFTDPRYLEARYEIHLSADDYLAFWRLQQVNVAAGPRRFQSFMQQLQAHLEEHEIREVSIPYRCRTWTVRRR
jgi:hypothetical protein